ncbi:Uncharacterized protein Fot_09417 [Forsythia ovata]|uniref:Uncharacterized protein n=1 Tax=Forsythia ovata TaxID=205694 RepID=A0ABD1WDY4_9LAMI
MNTLKRYQEPTPTTEEIWPENKPKEAVKESKYSAPKGICELVRFEVMWGEILRQRRFDFRVGQIFTEILWESVLGVGLLALSLRSLPLVHIPRFTTRLVKGPLTQEKVWVAGGETRNVDNEIQEPTGSAEEDSSHLCAAEV